MAATNFDPKVIAEEQVITQQAMISFADLLPKGVNDRCPEDAVIVEWRIHGDSFFGLFVVFGISETPKSLMQSTNPFARKNGFVGFRRMPGAQPI